MGNRLSKITTKTGDKGTTGLADGSRISKDDDSVHAMGDIDEVNSYLGLLLAEPLPDGLRNVLQDVQHGLFDIGGELALPGRMTIGIDEVEALEKAIAEINQDLPPLKEFILPGGNRPASICQVARAISRRAERALVRLSKRREINPHTLAYINRLSDLLFVGARMLARLAGGKEVYWNSERIRSPRGNGD